MHSDIAKAIDLIDQRIQALQNIRAQLVQEFGGVETGKDPQQQQTPAVSAPENAGGGDHRRNGSTRKDQVADFIRKNGPAYRSQIAQGVAVPAGTISYCLNDKARFQQLRDGKWALVE